MDSLSDPGGYDPGNVSYQLVNVFWCYHQAALKIMKQGAADRTDGISVYRGDLVIPLFLPVML